jgi:hypothetical protein
MTLFENHLCKMMADIHFFHDAIDLSCLKRGYRVHKWFAEILKSDFISSIKNYKLGIAYMSIADIMYFLHQHLQQLTFDRKICIYIILKTVSWSPAIGR